MDDTLAVLTTVLAGLVAGGLLVVEIGLVRAVEALPDATNIRLHVAFDHYVEFTMPELTVAAMLAAIAHLITDGDLSTAATTWTIVGIAGEVVVALVSQIVNFPINGAMRKLEPGEVPANYPAMRRRWNLAHRTRTVAGNLAFLAFTVAFLATY